MKEVIIFRGLRNVIPHCLNQMNTFLIVFLLGRANRISRARSAGARDAVVYCCVNDVFLSLLLCWLFV